MNVIFGANSFLGNNFIDYFEANQISYISLGENEPIIEKSNFILTDYSNKSLKKLDKFDISNVYIFKSLVRRDVNSKNEYEKINIHLFDRIVDYISGNHKVETIHYFSTKKNSYDDLNDLYLKTKIYQDKKIEDSFSKKKNLVFKHSLPRMLGPRDLNFSRLTPQYLSNKLLKTRFQIRNQHSDIEFLTISKFLDIFFQNTHTKSATINYETNYKSTVKDYLQLIDNYLLSKNYVSKNDDINKLSFIDWYVENQILFSKSYENWKAITKSP
tara:strand:+ start:206 stop:1018 length:813 start_codon:yes stop_codon:yes gene_type:complete